MSGDRDIERLIKESVDAIKTAERTPHVSKKPSSEPIQQSTATTAETKKCGKCAMMIQKEAKICPYCRKPQGFSIGVLLIAGFFILLVIGMCSISPDTKNNTLKSTPSIKTSITAKNNDPFTQKFKVVAQHTTALSILVPGNTTDEQVKALIYRFRAARVVNTLSKTIPATTKGGVLGDYGIVWIFIFSETDWATQDKLQRFINSSAKNSSDREFDVEYVNHIKGEYYYTPTREHGTLGYDDGTVRSQQYHKLF